MSNVKIKVLLGIVQCSEGVQCSEDVQCSEGVQCSEDVQCLEDVQIRRFPMVGVCPRVSKDVQRNLNVKQLFLF